MRVRHRKALCRDRFGACFWDFLRCSRYSSCRRDKLSKTGEFYLHICADVKYLPCGFVRRLLSYRAGRFNSARHSVFCACAVRRLFCAHCEFCSASGVLVMRIVRIRDAPSVSIPCACVCVMLCFGNPCVALHVARRRRLKFYVRHPVPYLAPPCEISCEVPCPSLDFIAARYRCLKRFARVD